MMDNCGGSAFDLFAHNVCTLSPNRQPIMYRLELVTAVWTVLFSTAVFCDDREYVVNYVSQRSNCEGPLPTAELSSRIGNDSGDTPFSEWNLDGHIAGNCTIPLNSNAEAGMLYQFRVELSPAASCWCVMVTVDITKDLDGSKFNCGTNQPTGLMLCAEQNQTTSFLSMVEKVQNPSGTILEGKLQNCNDIQFSTHNSKDIAIAYQNTIEQSMSCQNTCSMFPLIPVPSKTSETLINATVHFSLIMRYKPEPIDCADLNAANEGILLKADSSNSTHYLQFYYDQKHHRSSGSRIPLLEFLDNNTMVNLTYYKESFVVPGTFDDNLGLRNYSLDITQLIKSEIVTLTWEQHAQTPAGHECDLWSLDDVFVIVNSETSTKTIFSDDFQNMHAYGWTLMSSIITSGTINCSVENSHCLYSKGRNDIDDNFRFARTRAIDLRPVTAVKPLPAPIAGSLQDITCQHGLIPLLLRFQLQLRKFHYPTVSTDSVPNTVVLTVSDIGPQAQYAPVADTNWPQFNAADKYFYSSSGNIPVYSPYPNQLTEATACVNVTDRESLEITWRQDEFESGFDHWYLHIDQVMLANFRISNITDKINRKSYTLSKFNDAGSSETNASICGFTKNVNEILRLTGNDSSARLVNLTLNITHIFPKPKICPSDGIWNATANCTILRTAACPNSTFLKTRICQCNGLWGPVHCTPSLDLAEELIEVSPIQSLETLISVPRHDITNMERFQLLNAAFEAILTTRITRKFIENAVQILLDAMDAAKDNNTYDSLPDLLSLVDEIAREIRQNNFTIDQPSYLLKVQEVYRDKESFRAIEVDNSFIELPGELFSSLNDSDFIVSIYFKKISHLLPKTLASQVISSSCISCNNENLSENVTVFFDLPRTDNKSSCMFINLQNVSRSDDNFWIDDGCTTTTYENGSVNCSCNHLTHFAILLSPGVAIPPEHQKALTVTGQVFVSISLAFLVITILVFVLQRSLWNMRNYIHCMLCANLFAAQLVFVVGVERTEVEAVCSAIAVLLHYLYLVVFMWMLMEGVVLYVALIKVFIKHTLRYIIGFTILSYGLPLIYIGIVAPVGLLVSTNSTGNHYGLYNETSGQILACWLRYDTRFIFAMIIPVVLIIMLNLGFMTMALVVMRRHLKKQKKKSQVETARHWLKVIISLVVVMGVTWVGNLLFFDINLIFIAYIMTIIIACQGLIIFILFVILSKQVRDAYTKWWRIKQSQSSFLSRVFRTSLPRSSSENSKKKNKTKNNGTYEVGTFGSTKSLNHSSEESQSAVREYESIPAFVKEKSSSISKEESTHVYQTISKEDVATTLFISNVNAPVQPNSRDIDIQSLQSMDKDTGQSNSISQEDECYYETIRKDEDTQSTLSHEYQMFNIEFSS